MNFFRWIIFLILPCLVLVSCGDTSNQFVPNELVKAGVNPLNPFPTKESPIDPNNPQPTPDPGALTEPHTVGVPRKTASATGGKKIPITFIFINSSSQVLSADPQADAQRAIDTMNQRFTLKGLNFVTFQLLEAKGVVDDQFFNTNCNYLTSVANRYGTGKSMVMVVVNDLAGGCAGVSFLWKFPKDLSAVTMSEYRDPFKNGIWTPVVHEFAHSFGLHHTGNEYSGSVPTTGLINFNDYLPSSQRRCSAPIKYFINPQAKNNSTINDGILFESYHNTMYPSYGGKPDAGFFTAGYDYSMSWAFDCWYGFAKNDV